MSQLMDVALAKLFSVYLVFMPINSTRFPLIFGCDFRNLVGLRIQEPNFMVLKNPQIFTDT